MMLKGVVLPSFRVLAGDFGIFGGEGPGVIGLFQVDGVISAGQTGIGAEPRSHDGG